MCILPHCNPLIINMISTHNFKCFKVNEVGGVTEFDGYFITFI